MFLSGRSEEIRRILWVSGSLSGGTFGFEPLHHENLAAEFPRIYLDGGDVSGVTSWVLRSGKIKK